jgi:predicted amidophosphoribosyltransferase
MSKVAREISEIQEKKKISHPKNVVDSTKGKCFSCGADIRPDDRFCRHCGTPIDD